MQAVEWQLRWRQASYGAETEQMWSSRLVVNVSPPAVRPVAAVRKKLVREGRRCLERLFLRGFVLSFYKTVFVYRRTFTGDSFQNRRQTPTSCLPGGDGMNTHRRKQTPQLLSLYVISF